MVPAVCPQLAHVNRRYSFLLLSQIPFFQQTSKEQAFTAVACLRAISATRALIHGFTDVSGMMQCKPASAMQVVLPWPSLTGSPAVPRSTVPTSQCVKLEHRQNSVASSRSCTPSTTTDQWYTASKPSRGLEGRQFQTVSREKSYWASMRLLV